MILKDYLSIGGEHGLFRFIAQGRNAIIIEHLETGKRSSAFGSAKVSSLEDISIFTEGEDIPLSKVFDAIFEKHGETGAIDPRSDNEALKKWFGEILPEYDRERVYPSDIKKVATWYNTLHKLNLLVREEPEAEKSEAGKEEKKSPKIAAAEANPSDKAGKQRKGSRSVGKTESRSSATRSKGAPKAK